MLRAAEPGDEAALDAFLTRHAETSMFLRGNLASLGLFDRTSPHGTTYWLAGDPITAVFGLSNAGFAMSQAPEAPLFLWKAFAAAVQGRRLAGITGEVAQVAEARRALGVTDAPFALDAPEPLYRLELGALIVPDLPGKMRRPTQADRALILRWTRAYSAELHMSEPEKLDEEARGRTDRALATGDVRILEIDGTPVAMTAINSRLPNMVQIGGVYTPPDLRGRGYARRVVALHMAELRDQGIEAAILFASGPAACRTYEAIGFERIGTYALAILKHPVTIGEST